MMMRITRITFHHFKALRRFSLNVERVNVLTGANNAGKSTIIGALRVLAIAHRSAWNRRPESVTVDGRRLIGYVISDTLLPISMENVSSDYDDSVTSSVTFKLSNGCSLYLYMHPQHGCRLVPESPETAITTSALFKRHFTINLSVVPVLGPVEHEEAILERETVTRAVSTNRAARHFRNFWYHFPDGFDVFSELVKRTWSGMEIERPSRQDRMLSMFVKESRMTRELYWVGFGFQIWCQLLTHLHRASGSSLVVIDEPEVYLHPDIQRRLLGVLRELGPDILIATHSTEIIAEADPSDIVVIDKERTSAERIKDVAGVQHAMDVLGSSQNITLAALARNRRILFVEGVTDFPLIRRFARRMGMDDLGAGLGLTTAVSGGFGSNSRIKVLAEGIAEALSTPLMIGSVYDRDFFCDEKIFKVTSELESSLAFVHVLACKEMENYLLVPSAIKRAVERAIKDRRDDNHVDIDIEGCLEMITSDMKDEIEAQLIAKHQEFFQGDARDRSTLIKEAKSRFSARWSSLDTRLMMVSGKETLRQLRTRLSAEHGVSLSDARIVDAMHRDEVHPDLTRMLEGLEKFRVAKVSEHA